MYYTNPSISPTQDQELLDLHHSDPILIENNSFNSQNYLQDDNHNDFLNNQNDIFARNSYSPESSSSAETNLVSPPMGGIIWSEATLSPQHNKGVKRSNSVPPGFHKSRHSFMQRAKPLPIQIQKLAKEPDLKTSQTPVDPETYRRQLDDKLAKVNFDDITVAELKETLRERHLSTAGRKAELMNRLKDEYDLVVHQNNSHVMLNRRIANISLDQKKSPKPAYAPYHTPPARHASAAAFPLSPQLTPSRLASSVPTNEPTYLNDPFFKPSCLRESVQDVYINEGPSQEIKDWHAMASSQEFVDTTSLQPNIQYTPMKLEENVDIWDDQMLQNFLNQI